jgi:hypothetical protein
MYCSYCVSSANDTCDDKYIIESEQCTDLDHDFKDLLNSILVD